MLLSSNFNTNIYELLECVNSATFFISDWNKEKDILNFDINKIDILNKYHTQKNTYFFSDEFQILKENHAPFILQGEKSELVLPSHFSIVSNCTVAGYLCLYYINNQKKILNALILAPVYFSHIKILQNIGSNIYYIDCYNNENIVDDVYKIINHNKIDVVIATEPLFGTGVSISEDIFYKINKLCNEYKIYFLIDYAYGGMKWGDCAGFQETFFINLTKSKYTILIESICKRVFLNGVKHGIIIANPQIIRKIEEISVYISGCLSEQQILIYEHLYNVNTRKYVTEIININNNHYLSNYALIKTLLADTTFVIS